MSFSRIQEILPETLKRSGLPEHLEPATASESFAVLAQQLLPEALHGTFSVSTFQEGVLTVSCRSSAAAYGIRAIQETLLSALNERHPTEPVVRLRLMINTWR